MCALLLLYQVETSLIFSLSLFARRYFSTGCHEVALDLGVVIVLENSY